MLSIKRFLPQTFNKLLNKSFCNFKNETFINNDLGWEINLKHKTKPISKLTIIASSENEDKPLILNFNKKEDTVSVWFDGVEYKQSSKPAIIDEYYCTM